MTETPTATRDAADAAHGSSRELARRERPWSSGEGTLSWSEMTALGPALGRTVVRGGRRIVGGTAAGAAEVTRSAVTTIIEADSAHEVWAAGRDRVVTTLRAALGIDDIEARLRRLTVLAAAPAPAPPALEPVIEPVPTLRERAALLLGTPATADDEHPAFAVVLAELAPDELRLLRVLIGDGDQPLVDVVARGPLGGNERTLVEGYSLLAEATDPERWALHRDNLRRLGLTREVDDALDDAAYETLEARAKEHPARGGASVRMRRRRLTLTPFGRAFAGDCLPQ